VRAPKPRKGEKILRPVRPNLGLEVEYRRRLYALIDDMAASIERWVLAAYRKAKPQLAQDDATRPPPQPPKIEATYVGGVRPWMATVDGEPLRTSKGAAIRFGSEAAALRAARVAIGDLLPADELQAAMSDLGDYWLDQFDTASQRLARFFATSSSRRTDSQLRGILRDGGFSVKFQMTPGVRDVVRAAVHENVALIKSIPEQYLKSVEGAVMRSVQTGRDLSTLSKHLQKQYGVTKRRAAFIARDQNNKATAVIQNARQRDLGITTAVWMHSHGGKTPRRTHLANDGKKFDIRKGWYDPDVGEYILPGQLPNCRCVMRSVIPGLQE
jgi:SPP1 gp7 family putative phage head morphogenesis protein